MDDSPVPGGQAGPFTLINVFQVAPGSQDILASSVLSTAADIAASLPGFLDATVLRSVDGQRVVNYAHWIDHAAFETFMADPRTPARLQAATELGEPDGHAYVIAGRAGAPAAAGPLSVYRRMQQLIGELNWDQLSEVVDVEGYTENCVGLTPGWITGLAAAVQNYLDNVASGISDITVTELDALQTGDSAADPVPRRGCPHRPVPGRRRDRAPVLLRDPGFRETDRGPDRLALAADGPMGRPPAAHHAGGSGTGTAGQDVMTGSSHQAVAAGDGTVAVEAAGSGEPVVLLHGWPQTRYAWREVMTVLAPHYQVIAVDLPGLGDSSPPPDYRKSTIASLVWSAVRAVVPEGPVRLVGHDWGAIVGYLCANAAGSEVSRLAVIDVVTPLEFAGLPLLIPGGNPAWHFLFHGGLPELLQRPRGTYRGWFDHGPSPELARRIASSPAFVGQARSPGHYTAASRSGLTATPNSSTQFGRSPQLQRTDSWLSCGALASSCPAQRPLLDACVRLGLMGGFGRPSRRRSAARLSNSS